MRIVIHYKDDTREAIDAKAIVFIDGILELGYNGQIRVVDLKDVYSFDVVTTALDKYDF